MLAAARTSAASFKYSATLRGMQLHHSLEFAKLNLQ